MLLESPILSWSVPTQKLTMLTLKKERNGCVPLNIFKRSKDLNNHKARYSHSVFWAFFFSVCPGRTRPRLHLNSCSLRNRNHYDKFENISAFVRVRACVREWMNKWVSEWVRSKCVMCVSVLARVRACVLERVHASKRTIAHEYRLNSALRNNNYWKTFLWRLDCVFQEDQIIRSETNYARF